MASEEWSNPHTITVTGSVLEELCPCKLTFSSSHRGVGDRRGLLSGTIKKHSCPGGTLLVAKRASVRYALGMNGMKYHHEHFQFSDECRDTWVQYTGVPMSLTWSPVILSSKPIPLWLSPPSLVSRSSHDSICPRCKVANIMEVHKEIKGLHSLRRDDACVSKL